MTTFFSYNINVSNLGWFMHIASQPISHSTPLAHCRGDKSPLLTGKKDIFKHFSYCAQSVLCKNTLERRTFKGIFLHFPWRVCLLVVILWNCSHCNKFHYLLCYHIKFVKYFNFWSGHVDSQSIALSCSMSDNPERILAFDFGFHILSLWCTLSHIHIVCDYCHKRPSYMLFI